MTDLAKYANPVAAFAIGDVVRIGNGDAGPPRRW